MARSKQVTKKAEKKAEAPLTTKKQNETPYQLDPAQVERAANALVAHMKKHKEEKEAVGTKDLMADEDEAEENDQPIFLSVSTKKHVSNSNSLKPTKMSVCMLQMRRTCILTNAQCPASPHHCERR
jgi:ribosome biogenesis protein UTP30